MENYEIIRKLDEKETIKSRSGACENFAATFRLRSQIDLFEHKDEVEKAIQTWKRMHKLLRAKVVEVDTQLFFVLNDNSSVDRNLENVHFIRINSTDPEKRSDVVYNLVLEKCFLEAIDVKNELLWRMIFIEVSNEDNKFVYEVILQFHHIIADGVSANKNFLLLLEIIEKTVKSIDIEDKDIGVYPGTIDIFSNEINSITKRVEIPIIKRPSFIDPERAQRTSFEKNFPSDFEAIKFELIDLNRDDGMLFAKSDELFHISKEISNMKVKRFVISQDVTTKLIKKCKQEGVKMTTCLSTATCVALSRLYKKHGERLNEIVEYTSIDLRRFRPQIGHLMLGYCVGGLQKVHRDELNISDDLGEKFWQIANENQVEFNDRVSNDNEKFDYKYKPCQSSDKLMAVHIGMSNLGQLDEQCLRGSFFDIDEKFIIASYSKCLDTILLFNSVSTVKRTICWSLTYNSFFIDQFLIDDYTDLVHDVLEKICS